MAAIEIEKQRLWKRMQSLSAKIERTKQQAIGHTSLTANNIENGQQQMLSHRPHGSSNKSTGLKTLKIKPCLPQQKTIQVQPSHSQFQEKCGRSTGSTEFTQHKAASQHRKPVLHSSVNPDHDSTVSCPGTSSAQTTNAGKAEVSRKVAATSAVNARTALDRMAGTAMAVTLKDSVVHSPNSLTKGAVQSVPKMAEHHSSQRDANKPAVYFPSGCTQSAFLVKNQLLKQQKQGSMEVKENNTSSHVKHLVQHQDSRRDTKCLQKNKLISRSAEVKASNELMYDHIEDLKLQLEKLTAMRKDKKKEIEIKLSHLQTPSQVVKSGSAFNSSQKSESYKHKVSKVKECQQNLESVSPSAFDSNHVNKVECGKSECVSLQLNPALNVSSSSNKIALKEPEQCPVIQLENNPVRKTHSSTSKPLSTVSSVSSKLEKTELSKVSGRVPSRSPSKSTAKADLTKDLKAAELKLHDMLEKAGVMLNKSTEKLLTFQNSRPVTVPQRHQSQTHATQSVNFAVKNTPALAVPLAVSSKSNLSVNHKLVKVAAQKSPSTEFESYGLVVGNSPSLRSFQKSPLTTKPNGTHIWKTRTDSIHSAIKVPASSPTGRKSCYTLVKKNSIPVTGRTHGPSQVAVSSLKKRHAGKSFVSRFKLQKCNNPTKPSCSSTSSPQMSVVNSRYKLIKHNSGERSLSQVSPTQLTPVQKVAQVIKSKYKMKKVPVGCSPFQSVANMGQNRHGNYHTLSTKNIQNYMPCVWFPKAGKFGQYPSLYQTHPFLPSAPHRGQQRKRGYSLASEPRGPWSKRLKTSIWSKIEQDWMNRLTLHKAKTAMAWKMQWQRHSQKGKMSYKQWKKIMYHIQKDQLQKKLLLKRLKLREKYSLTRKQPQTRHSPTKTTAHTQKREHLVMINGILYKSNSTRLTKASPKPSLGKKAVTKSSSGGTGSVSSSVPVSNSSSFSHKRNNTVIVRNVKQHKMQTVTVRGVSFKVDTRGTRLQRVAATNHTGRTAAVSRVDVGGTTYIETCEGVLEKISDSQTRSHINRVKQRSISVAAYKSKKNKDQKKLCLYFSRFGKCSRGDKCPFIHDPAKIAVCTRFLRGTCQNDNCVFSHNVSKEKMPVCEFFLRGVCTRDPCPYLHVKVSQGAEVCPNFIMGFCPLAEKCQKLHTLICPHFAKSGACPDGKKCRLQHRQKKVPQKLKRKLSASSSQLDSIKTSHKVGVKRPAQGERKEDKEQGQGEDTGPPQKSAKLDSSTKLQDTPHRLCPSQEAVTADPSSQKLGKLPAFISLTDISFDESPFKEKLKSSRFPQRTGGPSLQIKPHI